MMYFRSSLRTGSLVMILLCSPAFAQQNSGASGTNSQTTSAARDGQHDFDFEIGTWKTHLRRLTNPLTGSKNWAEYEGTTVVRRLWNGRANLVELEVDGPGGHVEGVSLRLYNPQAHQWSLNFANSKNGTLSVPTVGEFKDGRGEFYDQEPWNGRVILVRNVWSDISADSCHFEQAFSDDGGKTWEANWTVTDTRMKDDLVQAKSPSIERETQHDFDFELGTWNIHLSRLVHPLAGSKTWVEFDGKSVTRKVWDGRAFIEEFETEGSTGHVEGLTLRTYNPQAHQWNLYWANSKDGILAQPTIGEFKDGRGEFYDQEPFNGKAIFVRYIWSEMTANSAHFEQSFSEDGGKTWEVNWITDQKRVAP